MLGWDGALAGMGLCWLHVHPDYVITDAIWAVVRLARNWEDSLLPEAGGVQKQAAWTVAAIDIVRTAWAGLRDWHAAKDRKG